MNIVVADFGYGDVKYIVSDREFKTTKKGKFPNAVAKASKFLNKSNYTQDNLITYNGKKFLVGEEAALHSPLTTRSFSYLKKYSPLLLIKLMIMEGIDKIDALVTGLALSDFNRKDEYEKALSAFSFDGRAVEIPKVLILPQGYGIYLDFVSKKGKIPGVLVIDIGYNTVDVGYINKEGKFDVSYSKAYENEGIVKIVEGLAEYIREEIHRLPIPEPIIKQALVDRKIEISGEEYNLSDVIDELSEDYAEYLLGKIEADYKTIMGLSKFVIVAGGGARFVRNYLEDMGNIFIPEEPEFANVRGYYQAMKG